MATPGEKSALRPWMPIALVVGGLLAGVLLTEACYRVARRFVCIGASSARVWRLDYRYGWGHKPNGEGWMYGCFGRKFEWRVYNRMNSLGLRDRERTLERQPGVARVLLLGDSMTESMQVPFERTFPALTESSLRTRGVPVEILNAGVASYGTDNELRYFRADGADFRSDVVLLVFNVSNDIVENSRGLNGKLYSGNPERLLSKMYFHLDDAGALTSDDDTFPLPLFVGPPSLPHIPLWTQIETRLYLARAVSRLLTQGAQGGAPPPPAGAQPGPGPTGGVAPKDDFLIYDVTNPSPDPEWESAWRLTEALVRAMRVDVEQSGARFAVAVMPIREATLPAAWGYLTQIFPKLAASPHDPDYPVRRISAFLAHEGIPYLDLSPALRAAAARTGRTGYFSWDVHLDVPGHAVVAEALDPFIADLVSAKH